MGGCCCCSRRGAELDKTPVYSYCPQEVEVGVHESLSSTRDTSSAVSAGLLVDTNLQTLIPDINQVPPAPFPCVGTTSLQVLPENLQNRGNKTDHMQQADSQLMIGADGRLDISGAFEKSDSKIDPNPETDFSKPTDEFIKLSQIVASAMDEEDVCPICLEEYDVENPCIITECKHDFHLSCILEWMERSAACPICDQVMLIDDESHV